MTSRAVHLSRRAELERRIEDLIALLDDLDGDENLEEGGDADWSGHDEELPTRQWTGAGVAEATAMIEANAKARLRPPLPAVPLIYYFMEGCMGEIRPKR